MIIKYNILIVRDTSTVLWILFVLGASILWLIKSVWVVCIVGEHYQFDNMIYPETKTKGGWKDKFKGWIGSSQKKDGPTITVPDHEAMQEHCLLAYLDEYKLKLVNCELSPISELTIVSLKNDIFKLFDQQHKQRTYHHEHRDVRIASRLPQVCHCELQLF